VGGSPLGSVVQTRTDDNHHQGLGLAHLVKLIRDYSGELCIVSGNSILHINTQGQKTYEEIQSEWQGVGISCKLKESELIKFAQDDDIDDELKLIMRQLGGNL
jgi:hypothetical protein